MKVFAHFVTSAASPSQFPAPSVPEVAFLGRSNVGKSSLLNSLTGARVARVSNMPGRTQTINFYALNLGRQKPEADLIFADLPGYGYARVPETIVGEWPKFIEPYLVERETLRLCVCLVDPNIPPQKSDLQLVEWLRQSQRDFVIAATKIDRMSGNELSKSLRAFVRDFGAKPTAYSAKTGNGRDELWRAIRAKISS